MGGMDFRRQQDLQFFCPGEDEVEGPVPLQSGPCSLLSTDLGLPVLSLGWSLVPTSEHRVEREAPPRIQDPGLPQCKRSGLRVPISVAPLSEAQELRWLLSMRLQGLVTSQ